MKKMIAAILAALMLASMLAGCTGENIILKDFGATEEQTGANDTQPGTSDPDPTAPKETDPSETTQTDPSETEQTDPSGTEQTDPTDPTEPKPTPGVEQGLYTRAELEAMDTTVNGWGLGPNTDDGNRPIDATRAQEKYGQYDAYYIVPSDGKIYLTFDEGYENGYTAQILDVLKEKDVKAVFFVTMQYAKEEPELIQRMIDEGHVVGNHTVRHKSMPTLGVDEMIQEVVGLHEYILDNFGYEMSLFRPPMGEFSVQSLAVLQNLGYKTVEWSFAYYDYAVDDQPEHQKAYDKIVGAAHSGAIYLLHAVSETNTAVLGDVIDAFRAQGFELALME